MDHKLAKRVWAVTCLSMAVWLTGCDDKPQAEADNTATVKTATAESKPADLPDNAPALGTDVATVVPAKKADGKTQKNADGVTEIRWEDLIPVGHEPEKVMEKFRAKIDSIPEGAPEERALLKEVQSALNSAPVNTELQGKKVKLPGFVSPLDEKDGMVSEFLLVPYFGACIHVPPPPLNQTLLVKPQEGKSIAMDKIYEPVWVTGMMSTDSVVTDLAQAGYVISDAEVTPFEGEVGADY